MLNLTIDSIMMETKTCTKCDKSYSATTECFGSHKQTKDGLQSWCRLCCRKLGRILNKKYQRTEKGKERHRQDQTLYRQRHPKRVKEQHYNDHQKYRELRLVTMRKYDNTAEGYLRHVYGDIKRRCSGESKNPKDAAYIKKGIKCLFISDEFVDYVINDLRVDPRGKQIHRIDNNGHYEKGNIVFKIAVKHRQLHNAERGQN